MHDRVATLEETVGDVRERLASLETSMATMLAQQAEQTRLMTETRITLSKWGSGVMLLTSIGGMAFAVGKLFFNKLFGYE